MTERGFEKVLLSAVFQQRVVHRVCSNLETDSPQFHIKKKEQQVYLKKKNNNATYLLVDLDGLLVLFQLSAVTPHLEQAFIGRTEENTYGMYELFPRLFISASHKKGRM